MVLIAVLGCGTMGSKIAGNFAYHGHIVKMYDSNTNQLDTVRSRIDRDREQLYRDGLIEKPFFTGQILAMQRLEDALIDVEFVFECVFEDLDLKRNLISNVSKLINNRTIICSNTIDLDLNRISENVLKKENFIGVRFLFPVYYIREVEINLSQSTNTKTIDLIRKLLESMDKILFFRSTSQPFILDEQQREQRRRIRLEFMQNRKANRPTQNSNCPELSEAPTDSRADSPFDSNGNSSNSKKEDEFLCIICSDHNRNVLLRPCNHFTLCFQCAEKVYNIERSCPICRSSIEEIIHVFT